jgi:hypothetical protein
MAEGASITRSETLFAWGISGGPEGRRGWWHDSHGVWPATLNGLGEGATYSLRLPKFEAAGALSSVRSIV